MRAGASLAWTCAGGIVRSVRWSVVVTSLSVALRMWREPTLCCVMLETQSSVLLFRVQLSQVSSSSWPAGTVIVETDASYVHACAVGSHGLSAQPASTIATITRFIVRNIAGEVASPQAQ